MSQYAAHLGTVMLMHKDATGDLFYVQIKGQSTPRFLRDKLEAKEMPSSIKSTVKKKKKSINQLPSLCISGSVVAETCFAINPKALWLFNYLFSGLHGKQ